jgi:hypothetical protein
VSDALIDRLAADLQPVPPRALERRLAMAFAIGLGLTALLVVLMLGMTGMRPFGAAWGSPMFWVKLGYAVSFGFLGLSATPVLARPEGRIIWPLAMTAVLAILALAIGSMGWMGAGFPLPMLMGATALVCPWLILLSALPLLASLLVALRGMAPRSPTMAGLAAGLVAGGFGAAAYAIYCGETGMMFMAVWYSLGIGLSAGLGAILGRWLLRW